MKSIFIIANKIYIPAISLLFKEQSTKITAIHKQPTSFNYNCVFNFAAGLVRGHAYSMTKVVQAKLVSGSEIALVRIRNPWGDEVEWNGSWSDGSNEWADISNVRF